MECYACGNPIIGRIKRTGFIKCKHMIDETYEERCLFCNTLLYGYSRPKKFDEVTENGNNE